MHIAIFQGQNASVWLMGGIAYPYNSTQYPESHLRFSQRYKHERQRRWVEVRRPLYCVKTIIFVEHLYRGYRTTSIIFVCNVCLYVYRSNS